MERGGNFIAFRAIVCLYSLSISRVMGIFVGDFRVCGSGKYDRVCGSGYVGAGKNEKKQMDTVMPDVMSDGRTVCRTCAGRVPDVCRTVCRTAGRRAS